MDDIWFLHSPSLWCLGRRSAGWWSTFCPRTRGRPSPLGSRPSPPSSASPTCSGSSGRTPCPCASSWRRIPPRTLPSQSLSRSQSLLCTAVVTSHAMSLVSLKQKQLSENILVCWHQQANLHQNGNVINLHSHISMETTHYCSSSVRKYVVCSFGDDDARWSECKWSVLTRGQ